MSVALLFGAIVVAVFLIAFISARRFGPLALGLAAGSLLAELWAGWLTALLESVGVEVSWLPMGVVATLVLLLAPLIILLLGGPRYFARVERVLSACAIALLTAALLVKPLGKYLVLDGQALSVYTWLVSVWQYVVTTGLVLGIVDMFLLHNKKSSHEKKH